MPDLDNINNVEDTATTPETPVTPTLDYAHPDWFNHGEYLNNKVIECNMIKFQGKTDWTNSTVLAALAEAGQTPYVNFVEYGNANNVSPSPFFNVPQYLQAKADALNELPYMDVTGWLGHHPATGSKWTAEDVLESFREAGLSAWDHYTQYGQFENLNPSNAFDQAHFWTAKVAQLNAWENADGTTGFLGNSEWTVKSVQDYFRDNKLNGIMNLPDNSTEDQAALVAVVPAADQVYIPNWMPWGDHVYPVAVVYTDIALKAGENKGTDGNDNFIGTYDGKSTDTFTVDDTIDGGAGSDMLTLNISSNFSKGLNAPGMTNVETVTLNNTSTRAGRAIDFNTQNTGDVQTWNLNSQKGTFNLTELAKTGIEVNVNQAAGGTTTGINFARNVTNGPSDALDLGVTNVGTAKTSTTGESFAVVNVAGIEDLTITATGDNLLDLGGDSNSDATSITVDGTGNLKLQNVGSELSEFDASAARGNVTADLGGSTKAFTNIQGGYGSDNIKVAKVVANATIDGGAMGNDVLTFTGEGRFAPTMEGFETVAFAAGAITKAVTMDMTNITDVAAINLQGVNLTVLHSENFDSEITVNDFGNSKASLVGDGASYTLNYVATNDAEVKADITSDTTGAVNISDSGDAKIVQDSVFTVNQAESVSINANNDAGNGSGPTGIELNAANATTLEITADHNMYFGATGSLVSVEEAVINANGTNSEQLVSSTDIGTQADSVTMTINGNAEVNLIANVGGSPTGTVEIDAMGSNGNITIGNGGTATTTPINKAINAETVIYNGNYGVDTVTAKISGLGTEISTGAGADKIDITVPSGTAGSYNQPNAILSGGADGDTYIVRMQSKGFVQIVDWNAGDNLHTIGAPQTAGNLGNAGVPITDANLTALNTILLPALGINQANLTADNVTIATASGAANAGAIIIHGTNSDIDGAYIFDNATTFAVAPTWAIQLVGVTSVEELNVGTIVGDAVA